MTFYKYENGVFVEDTENYRKICKRTAITTRTGVLILNDCYYNRKKNKYCGKLNDATVELDPIQILKLQCVV